MIYPQWTVPPSGGAGGVAGPGGGASTDNALVRWDGTTGSMLQDSSITLSDVSGSSVTLATAAGTALAIVATAPTATTGASQAGKAASLTASAAVASTNTAGAAAGGPVTITAGAAARNASGNADGGPINLVPGVGVGGGSSGQIIAGVGSTAGSAAKPVYSFLNAQSSGLYEIDSNTIAIGATGSEVVTLYSGYLRITNAAFLGSTGLLSWCSGSANQMASDAAFSRIAAGVLGVGTGTAASRAGWMQWAGESLLAANATNATATMANTGLSVTVTSGRKYGFKCILYVNDSVAAEGAKFDFDGGAATATNFRCHGTIFDAALNLSSQTAALATDFASATVTGDAMAEFHGTFEPSSTGTFIPRFAQNSHAAGTLTLYRGSHLIVFDMP